MPISQEIEYTAPIASYSDAYLWVMYASIICAHMIYHENMFTRPLPTGTYLLIQRRYC
ncbi:hypothetical protein ASPTUDRAFT_635194 [Aspergillus tubingensis CBS 134.48]|uniref:Uncharacterized protein n=1 Tax=Aspergillus tubingensis (strain CBS 134.48) TaxID=767770 RepID=A0A1L9N3Y9_ASPTC|nr:hypothetical protein ASPTUDRAFT_635194 [Aspergillus tubingensis CBS 134.48]